jgi:uncharacterized protein (TIGR03437 family)
MKSGGNWAVFLCLAAGAWGQVGGSNVVTTFAGTEWTFKGDGLPATRAAISTPVGLGFDRDRRLLIADANNHLVSRVNTDGTITVIAGNGIPGYSGDGGPAVSASLAFPYSAVSDAAGNIYIADFNNHIIRRVALDGTISTYAGHPKHGGFSGDNGPAANADLNLPAALAMDASGNLYILDFGNQRVRRITPAGIISTVAGNGRQGFSGDGGPAVSASLSMQDNGLAFDAAGNLYISDWANNRIRRVDKQGIITTFAGNGRNTYGGDGGPALQASLNQPTGLAFDKAGNLIIADYGNNRIRRITPAGVISTIAGTGSLGFAGDGGAPSQAQFRSPVAAVIDDTGNIFVSDRFNFRVRRIAADLTSIGTAAGSGEYRLIPDGSRAAEAFFDGPRGLAFDLQGNLLVADRNNHYVRKVLADGSMRTIAGIGAQGWCCDGGLATQALISYPAGIVSDRQGNVYFSEYFSNRIRRVTPGGVITTYAGNGGSVYDGDNKPATQASLYIPDGLAMDASGTLYIADYFNSRIRTVTPDGIIHTFAGTGTPGFSGDNGPATAASLNYPRAVALLPTGELLIADTANYRIRIVRGNGTIDTFAGDGRALSVGDGGQARQASINLPSGLVADSQGNVFVIENGGHRVRRIDRNGVITTVLGTGAAGFSGDGGAASSATLNGPDSGLAVDGAGNLYVSDTGNGRIRVVLAQNPALSATPANLNFTASSRGARTEAQTIQLGSNLVGVPYTVQVAGTPPAFLSVTPSQGTSPGRIQVTADPSQLASGSYDATIRISAPLATPPSLTVNVRVDVQAEKPAKLDVSRKQMEFSFQRGGAAQTQQITISNTGGRFLSYVAAPSTSAGGGWLNATPPAGRVDAGSPVNIDVTVDPSALAAGTYTGLLTVTSSTTGEKADVPVNIAVNETTGELVLSQVGLTFTAVAAGGAVIPQRFNVLNGRAGTLNWSLTAAPVVAGQNWLKVSRQAGSSGSDLSQSLPVDVSVDPAGLPPGDYYGQIKIVSPQAINSPQTVSVILNVLPAGSKPGPQVSPTGLVFTGDAGTSPGSQEIFLSDPGLSAASYNSTRLTDQGNWLVHVPVFGSLSGDRPSRVVVQPDFSGLTPGVRRGSISFQFNDGSVRQVTVTSVVSAPGGLADKSGISAADGCTSSSLVPEFTRPSDAFDGIVLQPVPLEVRVVDNCGRPITSGAVAVQFSNGDQNIVLRSLGGGIWSNTWQPTREGAVKMIAIALSAEKNLRLQGEASRQGTLRAGGRSPLVSPGGVFNGASFLPGQPVAPGQWITLFGQKLAGSTTVANESPLPSQLSGTEVLLGGRNLPLLYTSDGQVNAQVPFDLTVDTQHQVVIRRDTALSVPEVLTVAPAQPAVFTADQSGRGQGVIFRGNAVADAANPAHEGDTVVIYCAGLGPVNPPSDAGAPAPVSPLSRLAKPAFVTIGNIPARVDFAGLTPGVAGVYQINAVVPPGVTPGDAVPVIITTSDQSSPPVTMAVH